MSCASDPLLDYINGELQAEGYHTQMRLFLPGASRLPGVLTGN